MVDLFGEMDHLLFTAPPEGAGEKSQASCGAARGLNPK